MLGFEQFPQSIVLRYFEPKKRAPLLGCQQFPQGIVLRYFEPKFPQSIVLRYFEPKVAASPQRHFRCFVYDNALTCISQRHCACYFAELIGDLAEIQRHIVAFFWTHVQNRMRQAHREHYVFDIFVGYKPEPDKPDQAKSGASASVAGSVMTNAASLKSASAKAATIRAFSSGQAPSVAASEPSAPELSGPIEAIDASAIIRREREYAGLDEEDEDLLHEHEREYAGLDEEDDEDLLHADLGAVLILEVLPFDTRVDGCLFDWGNPADRTVLESGEVMVAGERQFVSLPGNMVVPSATIRVLQMPPDNVLESLPPLWQHHAANTFKDTKFDEDIDPDIMGESTPHSSSPSKLNQDKTAASSLRHMERTATANFHREGSQPTVAPRSKGCVVM
ncbi:hypothetical protein T484DRAFT_1901848 [Baffinella frigidus]|nr:hypothetical protein T484DRAFT_1901848 [Cryptophyta sp. CCMP2293]